MDLFSSILGLYMSYVYLKKVIPDNPGIQIDDVGVIQDKKKALKKPMVRFLRPRVSVRISRGQIGEFDIHETGDRFKFKVCDRCFKRLETKTQFEDNRIKKDNVKTRRPSCRNCRKIKNGVNISVKDRIKWNKLRPEKFSDFTCPICNKTTIVGITKVVLDHDHKTGEVRGWLCESCNTGIGRFDDDPKIVQRAIKWLKSRG